jgi:DNA invertase Pin-like site-specific DNA recombinase
MSINLSYYLCILCHGNDRQNAEHIMIIGYIRVSKHEQNKELQLDALHKAECTEEHIYIDEITGSTFERKGLDAALSFVREGDTFMVWKLDRLGRSLKDLLETFDGLKKKGVEFISIMDKIDTSTPNGKLIFHIMGALAEWERDIIRLRTSAGLEAARARGRKGGRPKVSPQKVLRAQQLYDEKKLTVEEICGLLKISRATFYNYLAAAKAKQEK